MDTQDIMDQIDVLYYAKHQEQFDGSWAEMLVAGLELAADHRDKMWHRAAVGKFGAEGVISAVEEVKAMHTLARAIRTEQGANL